MSELHVVFGAGGPLGCAIVRQLVEAGRPVRAVVTAAEAQVCPFPGHADVVHANPMHRRETVEAARGATVVYRCLNTPVSLWSEVWLTAAENTIFAAREAGARIVASGAVYVYGPLQQLPATEEHPLGATGPKGKLRLKTQAMLMRAHERGDAPVVIARYPDIFGPRCSDMLYREIFRNALSGRKAVWFGDLDVLRSVVYVEDAAAAAILLADNADAFGQVWHVAGPGPITPRDFMKLAFILAGHQSNIGRLTGTTLRLETVFGGEARAYLEFQYLYEQAVVIDGAKFAARFPDFVFTPHAEAVSQTLDWFREHVIG